MSLGSNRPHRVPFGAAFGGAPVERRIGNSAIGGFPFPFRGRRLGRRPRKGVVGVTCLPPISCSTGARPVVAGDPFWTGSSSGRPEAPKSLRLGQEAPPMRSIFGSACRPRQLLLSPTAVPRGGGESGAACSLGNRSPAPRGHGGLKAKARLGIRCSGGGSTGSGEIGCRRYSSQRNRRGHGGRNGMSRYHPQPPSSRRWGLDKRPTTSSRSTPDQEFAP